KIKLIVLTFILSCLTACQSQDLLDNLDGDMANIKQLEGIQHDITVNILTSRYGGYKRGEKNTRASKDFVLTPFIINGDTALYIAQYTDGWEIYSASHATNMLLFSSDKGVFDINDPLMPPQLKTLILGNANSIAQLKKSEADETDSSWGGISFCEKDGENCVISVRNSASTFSIINSNDVPPGYWILLESKLIGEDTDTSPKYTNTVWDQSSPWNQYSKKSFNGNKALVPSAAGCASVAVAQYMYVTHYKDGIPKNSVTTATLNASGDDYSFSGESATIWDQMAKNIYEYGTSQAALLIGKVGHDLKAAYGLTSTSVDNTNLLAYLKKIYGVAFSKESFSMTKALEYLKSGYPVISQAWRNTTDEKGNKTIAGHTFLIDRYRATTKKRKYRYGRVRYPLQPGTVDRWMADQIDEQGNIIQYAYIKEEISEQISYDISMNWGNAYGMYDDAFYSPSSTWSMGSYNYDLDHSIIIKK
ncbi:MAG: C10 family peptidase, partial [Muribaculaceae bacterium]|nr:C10 family peptidase [Muribaculaceae bacterium]